MMFSHYDNNEMDAPAGISSGQAWVSTNERFISTVVGAPRKFIRESCMCVGVLCVRLFHETQAGSFLKAVESLTSARATLAHVQLILGGLRL